jgi:hypothetical protein
LKLAITCKARQRDCPFELDKFLQDELLDLDLSAVDISLPDVDLDLPAFDTEWSALALFDNTPEIDISGFDTEELLTLDSMLPEPDLKLAPLDLELSLTELGWLDEDLAQFCTDGCSKKARR